jgi:hypothetical protein
MRNQTSSLHNRLQRLAKDRWAQRGIRTLLHCMTLGLSLMSIGLGISLLAEWTIELEILGAIALLCIAIGAFFLLRPSLKTHDVAQRLDRRFELNQQLVTALEVSHTRNPEGVEVHLLDHATRTAHHLQRHIASRQRFPWSEIGTLIALALVIIGLLLIMGMNSPAMPTAAEALPPLVPPDELPTQEEFPEEPFAGEQGGSGETPDPNGEGQPEMSPEGGGGSDQESMAALADALRDQGATRPAAEALDQNDAQGAAQELRELADRSDQLEPETRNDIADAMQEAADDIGADNMPLTDQLRQSSYGMQLDEQSAAQALEELADAVEELGGENESPEQQGQGQPQNPEGNQGDQGQDGGSGAGGAESTGQRELDRPSERLGVEGVPLELEEEGEGSVPKDEDTQQEPDSATSDSGGFERGSPDSNNEIDTETIGEDPQRVPPDMRDVVREYFSPSP